MQNGNVKYWFEVGQSFSNDRWAGDQKQRLRVCVCLIVSRLLTSSGLSKQEDINIEKLLLDVVLVGIYGKVTIKTLWPLHMFFYKMLILFVKNVS